MDFTKKTKWVKDGHKTADPSGTKYARVVLRDSVWIALKLATMNGLNILRLIFRMPIFKLQHQRHIMWFMVLRLVSIKERRPWFVLRYIVESLLREATGYISKVVWSFLDSILVRLILIFRCGRQNTYTILITGNIFFVCRWLSLHFYGPWRNCLRWDWEVFYNEGSVYWWSWHLSWWKN